MKMSSEELYNMLEEARQGGEYSMTGVYEDRIKKLEATMKTLDDKLNVLYQEMLKGGNT